MEEIIEQIQAVINQIEADHLMLEQRSAEGKIKIPWVMFQVIFSYLCGVSISGYIRKRKLTVAAENILLNKWSVTDAGVASGYENTASFSRAFKNHFNTAPSRIVWKDFTEHRFLPIYLNIPGYVQSVSSQEIKAYIKTIDYQEITGKRLIGISSNRYDASERDLWHIYWKDEVDRKLKDLEYISEGEVNSDYLAIGYMTDFTSAKSLGNTYFIGRLCNDHIALPSGLDEKYLKSGTVAHARIASRKLADIIGLAYILMGDLMNKNGYEIDKDPFYWLEYYRTEFFGDDKINQNKEIELDIYIPCKKRNGDMNGGLS